MDYNKLISSYGSIEKKIHVTWKNKDILDLSYNIIKHGILKLKELNPEYSFEISDNDNVEEYIMKHISEDDYKLIKSRHIVEKTDLWRLLKIYNEGGIYMDIDRFCNIPLSNIIKDDVKCILPMHYDIDFSQDIMISCSGNIIHKRAIDLNLQRRRAGCTDVLSHGPITYFHAVTEVLIGRQLPRYPCDSDLQLIRGIINNSIYLDTYREMPPFNTIVYKGPSLNNDKDVFYKSQDIKHWVEVCGNSENNKPYGI
jgi:hypothetical protein